MRVNGEHNFVLEIHKYFNLDDLRNLDFNQLDLTGVALEDIPDEVALSLSSSFGIDPKLIKTIPIPVENVCPKFTSSLTAAPEGMMDYFFFKYTHLDSDSGKPNDRTKDLVLMEAKTCEVLMKNPHPNIAKYWGCYVLDGRIRALCFANYPMTLQQRKETGVPLDTERCLKGIRDGIVHMHGLGLIHNDINTCNIMMDLSDNPVIIDFDSCTHKGKKALKGGTRNWCIEDAETGSPENDFYVLKKLEEYLSKPMEEEVVDWHEDVEGGVY
ncbi:hypothetical protein ACHAP8_004013 [Fusarium lateritium]